MVVAGLILAGQDRSTECGRHTKRLEKVGRYSAARHSLGNRSAADCVVIEITRDHAAERRGLRPPVEEVGR